MEAFDADLDALSEDHAALLDRLLLQAALERSEESLPDGPRAIAIRDGSDATPLWIVHGSGGQVMFLHAVARHMAPEQPIYGIEAGGGTTHDAVAAYLSTLRRAQPSGPYRLGAYSAGCLIAFEIAGRLLDAGEQVDLLVLIDPVAPSWRGETPNFAAAPHDRLRRRIEIAMLAGVTPLNSRYGQIERCNQLLSDVAAGFVPRVLDLPIRILHGLRGPYVSPPDALLEWAALARRGSRRAAIDADHFEIVREPYAADVGRQLQIWLDDCPTFD